VGAEGQLYVGAFAATAVALYAPGPGSLNLLMATIAAFIAGAAWILVPAFLKVQRGINEVITTVMMNYIGIQFVSYLIAGPFQAPGALFPETKVIPHFLPTLIQGTSSSYGFVLALALAVVVAIVINFSRAGLALRAVGANRVAARYAGIHDRRIQFTAMMCSGGLCGIAGAVEIMGFQHRLQEGFSPGYGSQGLVAGILANGSSMSAVFFSLLLGGLQSGGEELQRQAGVPLAFVFIVQGLAILLLVGNWIRFTSRRLASDPDASTDIPTAVLSEADLAADDDFKVP
jgi:simple sugar transport system permease protein